MSYAGNGIGQIDRWVPEIWNSRMVSLAKKKSVWMDFIGGNGSGSPVVDYGDVEGKPGDVIHLPTTAFFTGNPITSDTADVEGQEQKITPDELQITLKMRRFATGWTDVSEDYSIINLSSEAMGKLAYQLADNMDEDMFIVATASHTYNLYGGTSISADSDLASTDVFNVAACRKIFTKLNFNRALPLGNINGNAMYMAFVHPYSVGDMQADSNYTNIAQYAEVRGASNPVFSGKLPVVNGVMIASSHNAPYSNSNTTASTTYDEDGVGLSTAYVTHVFACGAEAMAIAYKWRPRIKLAKYDADTKAILHASTIYGNRRLVEKSSLVGHYYATSV